MATTTAPAEAIPGGLKTLLPDLKALYIGVHFHPELPMQEVRSASEDFGTFGA